MKKIILLIVCFSAISFAQFKDQNIFKPTVKDAITTPNNNLIFGFFNPDNFQMNHSYNLSYSSFGGNGIALGVYTNSMFYKFSNKLNIQLDASLVHSPYNSLGKNFQNNINGIYLSKAQINYNPSKDFHNSIQYRNLPYTYYDPYSYYYPFGRSIYGYDPFWGE
jgi:hypothetical protein